MEDQEGLEASSNVSRPFIIVGMISSCAAAIAMATPTLGAAPESR